MREKGRPPKKKATELGARLCQLRKTAGLTQEQLSRLLNVPKRTICFYERESNYIPSNILPKLSEILGVSIETILGVDSKQNTKPGPKSKLDRQIDKLKHLPKRDQTLVSSFLEKVLAE